MTKTACPSPGLLSSTAHYENFPVASVLVPRPLRPAIAAVYQFARYGDDIADEGDAPPAARLAELERMDQALTHQGEHPLVEPLRPHMAEHRIPASLFSDLLSAFADDARGTRYADRAGLTHYCSRSANPVGRIMLRIFDSDASEALPASDAICSALQLINFIQDAGQDIGRGRNYFPTDEMTAHGVSQQDLLDSVDRAAASPAVRALLNTQCDHAEQLLSQGPPLLNRVPPRLKMELAAIVAGGNTMLGRVRREDPFASRIKLGRGDAPRILATAIKVLLTRKKGMTPDEYCQQKAAASGSSFYYSFLFLKGDRRLAITAMYAFCREVDDVVDESSDADIARRQLTWWRDELNSMQAGNPTHPVTRALEPHMSRFAIEKRWLDEIIDGMAMDLEQDRYLDYEGLKLYCHRAAGVVGCAAANIFGATDPQTKKYAERLGLALQLTNIIRDVGEDARRGRIYLPVEDLQRFDVSQQDILASRYADGFTELMAFQTERARQAYRNAYDVLPAADRNTQRPGLMMAAIYATLLREIERDQYRVLHQRIALTPIRKLLLASRTWLTAKAPLP